MDTNGVNNVGNSNGLQGLGGGGEGNAKLEEAFDYAIQEASQTLTITTKKGADLYAMKQRPQ